MLVLCSFECSFYALLNALFMLLNALFMLFVSCLVQKASHCSPENRDSPAENEGASLESEDSFLLKTERLGRQVDCRADSFAVPARPFYRRFFRRFLSVF